MKKTLILLLAAMVTFSLVPSCDDEDDIAPENPTVEPDEPDNPDEPENPDESGTEQGEATIDITLLHSSSSTLTFEWTVNGSKDAAAALDYNVALYEDEACTNLWVSWIVTKDLYQPANNVWVRFTFPDLDPGKDYWVKINADGDDSVYSEPFKATTKAFDYTVSTNTTAAVGDVLVAEDFKGLIHGGDVAYNAMAIGLYDEKYDDKANRERAAMRATYQHSRGENPDDYAIPADHSREFNIVTGGSVTAEYTEGTGLGDWCIGKGTNVSTRPGYAKIGGGSGQIGYLATPELSAIPEGYLATVKVQCDILSYNEDTDKGDYGHQLQISAIENVVVEDYQVDGWSTTSDNAVPLVADVLDIESAIGGSNADHDFYTFETTLDGVTNACRIRFCSNPAYYNGGSRFLLDNVVVTVESLEEAAVDGPLGDVTNLVASPSFSTITLTWNAVAGASGYKVSYDNGETTVEGTTFTLGDLDLATSVDFTVVALSAISEEYNSQPANVSAKTLNVEIVATSTSNIVIEIEQEGSESEYTFVIEEQGTSRAKTFTHNYSGDDGYGDGLPLRYVFNYVGDEWPDAYISSDHTYEMKVKTGGESSSNAYSKAITGTVVAHVADANEIFWEGFDHFMGGDQVNLAAGAKTTSKISSEEGMSTQFTAFSVVSWNGGGGGMQSGSGTYGDPYRYMFFSNYNAEDNDLCWEIDAINGSMTHNMLNGSFRIGGDNSNQSYIATPTMKEVLTEATDVTVNFTTAIQVFYQDSTPGEPAVTFDGKWRRDAFASCDVWVKHEDGTFSEVTTALAVGEDGAEFAWKDQTVTIEGLLPTDRVVFASTPAKKSRYHVGEVSIVKK